MRKVLEVKLKSVKRKRCVLLFFMEPVAMAKLFTTTIGWGVLGVIIAMEVVGYIFIRKITSIDV